MALATLSRLLPRMRWATFFVAPTMLRRHGNLIIHKRRTRGHGRPAHNCGPRSAHWYYAGPRRTRPGTTCQPAVGHRHHRTPERLTANTHRSGKRRAGTESIAP